MRFLLIFLVALFLAWRWRSWRSAAQLEKERKNPMPPKPTAMVACRACGVHIPASDALVGTLGSYCSASHRLKVEP